MAKKLSKKQQKSLIELLIKRFNDLGIRIVSPEEKNGGLYTIVWEKITSYGGKYSQREKFWACSMKEIKSKFVRLVISYFCALDKQSQDRYLSQILKEGVAGNACKEKTS